jgi:hypothetical protein
MHRCMLPVCIYSSTVMYSVYKDDCGFLTVLVFDDILKSAQNGRKT